MTATYITTTAAARQADVVPQTVLYWIQRYPGLARKIGGRWRLDPTQFQRILDGQQPLRNSR